MQIDSIRLGHANNSSSSHSILLNSASHAEANQSGEFEFGWDWFHLKDREDKARYLAATIYSTLESSIGSEHAAIVAKELVGMDVMSAKGDDPHYHPYVDHQSVITFPRKFGTKFTHNEFMKEFVQYVRDNPRVSIVGGNDNEESPDWVKSDKEILVELPREEPNEGFYARKDADWWTLYNRGTGAKVRMAFRENPGVYRRASKPELVDIKITDFCPYACAFCYQSSTKKGKHADFALIESLAWALAQAEVFEVALGGGEPTLHPKFVDILQAFSRGGITPNFTTFNMSWAKDDKKAAAVREHCGSFAVSGLQDVEAIKKWNTGNPKVKGVLQIPLGAYKREEVWPAVMDAVDHNVDVTFLGYKDFGRGKDVASDPYEWLLYSLMESNDKFKLRRFGADSLFIEQFGAQLKKAGIDERFMVTKEGAFSCYIDAVAKTAGPSSFTHEMHPLNEREPFSKFPYAAVS